MRTLRWLSALIALFAVGGGLLPSCAFAQAQRGSIGGRVLEEGTAQPIIAAAVILVGTNRRATTDQDGRFLLENVPAGEHRVQVLRLGYESQTQTTTVAAGEITTVQFVLPVSAITLDELVVTATGEQRKRELGHAIAGISAPEVVETQAVPNVSDLLTARVPGLQVTSDGGTVGASEKIRIRGANSVSLDNDPIIYVDGVRVVSTSEIDQLLVGGQAVSALHFLNPEEIESIEVVKGPSAATLYGTESANGVIRIKTKRGRAGPPRWNFWIEQGGISDPNDYPSNWAGVDEDNAIGFLQRNCWLNYVAQGLCEQDSVASFNVLENDRTSPFATGHTQEYGVSVGGGTSTTQYYFSGEYEGQTGVYRMPSYVVDSLTTAGIAVKDDELRPNGLTRISLRGNMRAQVLDNADVNVSLGYVTSDLRRTNNDNSSWGVLPSGYFGRPFEDESDGWGYALPAESMRRLTELEVERLIGSVQANWQPFYWLEVRATGGLDLVNQHDFRTDFVFSDQGTRNSIRTQRYNTILDVGATANWQLTPDISSRTSAAVQYLRDHSALTSGSGSELPRGCTSISCAADTESTEATTEDRTFGFYAEQQFGLKDRLFVTAGLRLDDNSAFGEELNVATYPKLSVSWFVSEGPFFPTGSFLSELRLRGAVGTSGLQPGTLENIRFFEGVPVTLPSGGAFLDAVGVTVGELGNVELKPERSTEWEFGADLSLLEGRVGLELTYYYKKTTDALINRDLAPSLGASATRFENLASVKNEGLEALVNAHVLGTDRFTWDLILSASYNSNKILELGEGVEPFGGDQRFVEGFPAGGYWAEPILGYDDANGDGILVADEVEVGDTAVFVGPILPKYLATLQSTFMLFDLLQVQALFDYRSGHHLLNFTEQFRCDIFRLCQALNDPSTPLSEQARAVATTYHPTKTRFGYMEEADFLKFRELSLTFFAPQSWARVFRSRGMSITLAGRNLGTSTDYTGMDPETNMSGGSNFTTLEFLTQPPVRYFTARVNLSY